MPVPPADTDDAGGFSRRTQSTVRRRRDQDARGAAAAAAAVSTTISCPYLPPRRNHRQQRCAAAAAAADGDVSPASAPAAMSKAKAKAKTTTTTTMMMMIMMMLLLVGSSYATATTTTAAAASSSGRAAGLLQHDKSDSLQLSVPPRPSRGSSSATAASSASTSSTRHHRDRRRQLQQLQQHNARVVKELTTIVDENNEEVVVQEEQLQGPSASPTLPAKEVDNDKPGDTEQLPTDGGATTTTTAAPVSTPPPKEQPGVESTTEPTQPPSLAPTISVVPTTSAPTVIRMDLLALELGLVKIGGNGAPRDRRRQRRRRRRTTLRKQDLQQQNPWRRLQNNDDDDHPLEAAVLDALNDFLCLDANVVAVRDVCPDVSKPLQVASTQESSESLVSHEPIVTVTPVLTLTSSNSTTYLQASEWTIQYPIVIAYSQGGYDDANIAVLHDRVQTLLNRKIGSNNSRLYKQIYNATNGYIPAIVAPNVTDWIDHYYNNTGGGNNSSNSNSTSNGTTTLPTGTNDTNTTGDATPVPYDPERLAPLRLAGIFILILTLDAYAVLVWLARRRRRRKVLEDQQEQQHDRENGDEDDMTVGFITVPAAGAADATVIDGPEAGPEFPTLLSPTFEGVSTSSSSTSSDSNKPGPHNHGPNAGADVTNDEAVPLSEPATNSADDPSTSDVEALGGSSPVEPERDAGGPTKRKVLWFT